MEKFNFKPKQWVLVRDNESYKWGLAQYSHYDETEPMYKHCLSGRGGAVYCIPYEGNEHLLGKTDDYVEPWQPKDGDLVVMYEQFIAICKNPQIDEMYGGYKFNVYAYSRLSYTDKFYFSMPCTKQEEIRLATCEEKETFLSKLAEIGKKWNPEKKRIEDIYQPKDGDFVYAEPQSNFDRPVIFIFQNHDEENWIRTYAHCYDDGTNFSFMSNYPSYCKPYFPEYLCYWDEIEMMRIATEEEKQQLLDALHKEGKDWDAEKKKIVEYKWKPKEGEEFYMVSETGKIIPQTNQESWFINDLIEIGNCFHTKAEAQAMADKFKELLKSK